eukprot:TRINITY_DN56272_c0_g1_i1.p1 TRINITY_DN56272_c0_g1~~TRINITY_DN56272_c0_g1_i1.p1  ORF type:complete len:416 (+),score=76.89 TRINITY_DN56272_c0_g1_i1:39-1286(+)
MMLGLLRAADPAIGWAAYLLVSPTRSSLAGAAPRDSLPKLVALHNGELHDEPGPSSTAALRPWRIADAVDIGSRFEAETAARRVARCSGFRARLTSLRDFRKTPVAAHMQRENSSLEEDDGGLLMGMLDGLTYVPVEFANPSDPTRRKTVLALVDTGSASCDLRPSIIEELELPESGNGGLVETAAGQIMETRDFNAIVRVGNVESRVLVNAVDEDEDEDEEGSETESGGAVDDVDREFGFLSNSDDAVLGSGALAALGLLVDCKNRRVIPLSDLPSGSSAVSFGSRMRVGVEFGNPTLPGKSVRVSALVDSGCTDMDLGQRFLTKLELEADPDEGTAQFETAGGVTIQAPIYWTVVRILGREALVRASPSEAEVGDAQSDEALLGHDALASLGLLVDCRGQRLLAPPASQTIPQ